MAHFAELGPNNEVLRVIVVANKDTSDARGVEKEYIGKAFCERLHGGRWVQTSYNASFRKHYAGLGFIYDENLDMFIPPQPYPSWTLNQETAEWEAPTPRPDDEFIYHWDEDTGSWVLATQPE